LGRPFFADQRVNPWGIRVPDVVRYGEFRLDLNCRLSDRVVHAKRGLFNPKTHQETLTVFDSQSSSNFVGSLAIPSDKPSFSRIDHIAIAVIDLEQAITFYTSVLGFNLVRRLEIKGKRTGMFSAELEMNGIKFVLCQGTEPESQVSLLIQHHGPCVAHIALEVDDVHATVDELKKKGLRFDTSVIGTGTALEQAFTSRDKNSGISLEFIKRDREKGFLESNVQELFDQLEQSGSY
jgi:methylmalonyl-CoA/ethylmalonyl-CoA epimerase